jgi:DHA1 family bicyclomycin/chloramphenicol resistance-like MFS transporter
MSRTPFRLYALLAACAAVGPLQLTVFLPSLPLVQQHFAADVAEVQWTVSLPMTAFGIGLILFGPISDRLGRRPVLLWALGVFSIASVAAAFAPVLAVLVAARSVQAAMASLVFITARAVIADLTPKDQLQRSVALLTMIALTSQMIAPLLGNLAMSAGGWRVIQYALTTMGLVLWTIVALRLRESLQAEKSPLAFRDAGELLRPTWDLVRRPGIFRQFMQVGLLYAAYPAFVALAPHLMVDVFHQPLTHYGYYFALLPLGYFAGNAFVLHFGDRVSSARFVQAGSLCAAAAALLATVLLSTVVWHPAALFVPGGLLLNFGLGLALPSASARIITEAWPNTASAWGLAGFSQQVIGACGVQLLGFFPSDTPYPMLILCGVLALLPAIIERHVRP